MNLIVFLILSLWFMLSATYLHPKITITVAFKLGTLVRHLIPSVYVKNNNSTFHFIESMALFSTRNYRLKFPCKLILPYS
jgi:hypothetical protein